MARAAPVGNVEDDALVERAAMNSLFRRRRRRPRFERHHEDGAASTPSIDAHDTDEAHDLARRKRPLSQRC